MLLEGGCVQQRKGERMIFRAAGRWDAVASIALLCASLIAGVVAPAGAAGTPALTAVGVREIEYVSGGRTLTLNLFYPAAPTPAMKPMVTPFFINLKLYRDAPISARSERYPLIMFSHGRGSNGFVYAWFAQYLAARGYVVAAPNHYRANSYDSNVVYLANKLWQRPVDIGLDITHLLHDPLWGPRIDAGRIGVAGHSQGGFTALWVGGARVNAEKYLAFQRGWRGNLQIPASLRAQLPVDAGPALDVRDRRVKAVFAMAPGVVKVFGMDEPGLRALTVPTFITVGAGDTVTLPADNAEFAAKYVPNAKLLVIPGRAGHNVYVNECDAESKAELPEMCADDPGVDRAAIHAQVGAAALQFFNASLAVRPH
jgi:predicted dienelactone hydrolase